MLPYSRHDIGDAEIEAVVEVLRGDWLTTGPRVAEFEASFAAVVRADFAVAVSNGTAALHTAMHGLGIGPGDEVIVPAMTFAASANCVVFQGGTPVFSDVDNRRLLIDPESVAERITPKTRAVIAVDYAGQPCDYDALGAVTSEHGIVLVADACHSLGGTFQGRPAGSLAAASAFSFHPVKPITTGEGGMLTTDDPLLADRFRAFRNHGITTDHRQRQSAGTWFYEMVDLGFNYRLTDLQSALGLIQLSRLDALVTRRREIAARYDQAFREMPSIEPLAVDDRCEHAYHLYVVRLSGPLADRGRTFELLREAGLGVNVHYVPVHLHPFYRRRFGTAPGLCPVAEQAYQEIISLPLHPRMTDGDVERVITIMQETATSGGRRAA